MKRTLIFLTVAALSYACTRDFDIEAYTHSKPALCIASRMSDADSLHIVCLSISSGRSLTVPPEDAQVQLLENDTIIAVADTSWTEVFPGTEDKYCQAHRIKATLKPGTKYTLIATAGTLCAKSTVSTEPEYKELAGITDSSSVRDYMGFHEFEKIKIRLNDVPGSRSYYCLDNTVYGIMRYMNGETVIESEYDDCGKVLVQPYIDGGLAKDLGLESSAEASPLMSVFNDYHFQDGCFYINASFKERFLSSYDVASLSNNPLYDRLEVFIVLKLGMMNADDYNNYELGQHHGSDLFYDPVMVPNNIEGGYGHFGIVSFTDIIIPVETIHLHP